MTKIRQWSIFTAVVVLIVFVAGYLLLIKPQHTKTNNLNSQAAAQVSANQALEVQIQALQAEEKNNALQQRELNKFSTEVPAEVSEPTLILQLQQAATVSGVNLISITPGAATAVAAASTVAPTGTQSLGATTASTLQSLPLTLGVTGTYPNMEMFFQSLEHLPRALLVNGWSMCPVSANGAVVSSGAATTGATCTAPSIPTGYTLAPNSLGATLTAAVFFAPPAGSTAAAAGSTTLTPSTTTTPAPTTTTTPAAGATTAPAN